ncbi:hypothetical protein WA1_07260 [Scytonema hofmannii PCC 7110]|uniref:CRISPR-associated RAMP family protein n=1 Tax=Scytonema hofmannii PCC 7110 TaxID=128403 RepID=A0A139WT56_9CYAN|nr:TIGR03986 family CRISPR-associated RAMP protein [Scytonema hofmannii]KYC35611.1 hypothetical protein WA1_07260 [Scytonema hofmannii PCC 7110]
MNPRHIKEITDPNRIAVAPYNFVELPSKIVEIKEEDLPQQNIYSKNRYTGSIQCKLTTESPLYIRCGLTKEEFACGAESKDLPNFFYTEPEFKHLKPVLPGSSLRGMIHNLVEIISFSKITKVINKKPFYRSLGDKALKEIYSSNFIEESKLAHPNNPSKQIPCYRSKVHTGFIRVRNNGYIIEECGYGRIDRVNIPYDITKPCPPLYLGKKPGVFPNWKYQHQNLYVDIDANEKNYFFQRQVTTDRRTGKQKERHQDIYLRYRSVNSASLRQSSGMTAATLVITGDMRYKHLEFVFLQENLKEYQIPREVIQRFHDDDQITKWQEDAFPKGKPNKSRKNDGHLRDGEPVFFLLNEDGETIRFLGRAQMFRLPYDLSPYDLIPENLCDRSKTDIAEAIFGYVGGQERKECRAGRVFFSDAVCTQPGNVWLQGDFEKTLTPKILGSPKPTTFQHYLVQTREKPEDLQHYSPQKKEYQTTIRGHKLYWHKQNLQIADIEAGIKKSDVNKIEKPSSQHTKIKPIKVGVQFTFDIHFENLTDIELGAILWILQKAAEPKYCLSLGMGKPLGMGAVKIEHQLLLSNRQERYSKLFSSSHQWLSGEDNQSKTDSILTDCINAFEQFIVNNIHLDDHPEGHNAVKLNEIPRIKMLLLMLQCDRPPSSNDTRYMTIEAKEYINRPVLPTPFQVMGELGQDKRRFRNTSNVNLPKPTTNIPLAKASQQFKVGQILDATVSNIKGVKVTYQLPDGIKKTTEEHKAAKFLEAGQNVKVKITAVKDDGSIKNVKYHE